ncbi:TAT-variant-translocated molybdopterin oxidoreductase [Candidatus Sumerlaeota bacterium]|nr:TAT-variant-translocated molybdopterin oxidoreductase [Candidatus Sumerlaeota bacterium]
MSSLNPNAPRYWRSLDDLAQTEEFAAMMATEFPGLEQAIPEMASRRTFLKLMGASVLFAGLTGCQWPEEIIAPHAHRPDGRLPGVPVHYATTMEFNGVARGLLVTSYDGRPIKIEGNPDHPQEHGGADLIAQASILELYDPARTRIPFQGETHSTWAEFQLFAKNHFGALASRRGTGLRVLSQGSSSPTLGAMKARFLATFPEARWHEFEPVSRDNERAGFRLAAGKPLRPDLRFNAARVILSLDADLLMTHPAAGRYAREFADQRVSSDSMNRLYAIESTFSVTGSNADHRFAVAPSDFPLLCVQLLGELAALGVKLPGDVQFGPASSPEKWKFLRPMAKDLVAHAGQAVVSVGPRQPAVVHAMAHVMNTALRAHESCLALYDEPDATAESNLDSISSLAKDIRDGQVDTLLILGGNPCFDAPLEEDFPALIRKVPNTIHLGLHQNETAKACSWHLPQAHYLESWGDARAWDGTYSVCQPLIAPLFTGKSAIELLSLLLDQQPADPITIVRSTFDKLAPNAGEAGWMELVRDGFLKESAFQPVKVEANTQDVAKAAQEAIGAPVPKDGTFEIVHIPDHKIHDGRFANNAWLQELPDPITKVVWNNPALISVKTAESLHANHGDVLRITMGERALEVPAFILPGIAEDTIVLAMGYGRSAGGPVAEGIGNATAALRTIKDWNHATAEKVTTTGARAEIVTTQDHYAIDRLGIAERERRSEELIREYTPDEAEKLSKGDHGEGHSESEEELLVTPPVVDGEHRWAMTIDLSRCNGCNACVVACQAENNIPVVGAEQVAKGRSMQWLRVDRYYRGDPNEPEAVHQPVPCMHCENAPCEQVCPVAATMHDTDGLNVMVYNRCVGTRYCSNNCPWKVRRFNYFNFNQHISEVEKMQKNPEVTIRARGVMEKCSYCIQRISAVKIAARNEGRPITDGEIMPACAQTCPAKAIVFGDLNDPKSRISEIQHKNWRDYGTLDELRNKPRTRYLARLRNPNPELNEVHA